MSVRWYVFLSIFDTRIVSSHTGNYSKETHSMTQSPDLSYYRRYFPSLDLEFEGKKAIYFDNPGGTQVAQEVIDAMVTYFREANANTHGAFLTSNRTDQIIADGRSSMADLLHAPSPIEIVFGADMTTLTVSFRRALGTPLHPV